MKKLLMILLFASLSMMFVITGCSDDDGVASLSDEDIEAIEGQATMVVYDMQESIISGLTYADPTSLAKPADMSDSTFEEYDAATGWLYHFYSHSTFLGDIDGAYMSISGEESDSVRIVSNVGQYMETPDETTDTLQLRGYYEFVIGMSDDTTTINMEMISGVNGDYSGLSGAIITVDGDYDNSTTMEDGESTLIFDTEGDYDQVQITSSSDYAGVYPHAGSMSSSMHIEDSVSDDVIDVNMIFTFSATGYHGEMTINGETFTWDATWDEVEAMGVMYGGM